MTRFHEKSNSTVKFQHPSARTCVCNSVALHRTAGNRYSIVCLSRIRLFLISECGTFGARYWPTQPACASTYRDCQGIPPKRKTASLSRVGDVSPPSDRADVSLTSSRSFPDPRHPDALRRCPCQGNAAIPSYRVYVATGFPSCSASPGDYSSQ